MVTNNLLKGYLEDRNYLLPYSEALAFCYLNGKYFYGENKPSYVKYFKPFDQVKKNTFYDVMFEETMCTGREILVPDELIIKGIYCFGLTDYEHNNITVFDNKQMLGFQEKYFLNSFGIKELNSQMYALGVTPDILEYLQLFNINITETNDNIVTLIHQMYQER